MKGAEVRSCIRATIVSSCIALLFAPFFSASSATLSGLGEAGKCVELDTTGLFHGPTGTVAEPSVPEHPKVTPPNPPPPPEVDPSPVISAEPLTYKDKRTNTLFYVESDGRHVAAIDSTGQVLWIRNPFVDACLCPYRTEYPTIAYIYGLTGKDEAQLAKEFKRKTRFIGIRFNSSQFGVVDQKNGDFFWMGQD
jgi:hypothetical protein